MVSFFSDFNLDHRLDITLHSEMSISDRECEIHNQILRVLLVSTSDVFYIKYCSSSILCIDTEVAYCVGRFSTLC